MKLTWIKSRFVGVRYREHDSLKHRGRPDKYFSYRYQVGTFLVDEGVGWASDGWTESKVSTIRSQFREAAKKDDGSPRSLNESRERSEKNRELESVTEEEKLAANKTLKEWGDEYLEELRQEDEKTAKADKNRLERFIYPILGNKPIAAITTDDINAFVKRVARMSPRPGAKTMSKKVAPRTVEYMVTIVGKLCKYAGLPVSPTTASKKIKYDNKSERYLTKEEAVELLEVLKDRSKHTHDQAVISLHCGLRAGEVFSLKKVHVDFNQRTIRVFDTKNKARNRTLFFTETVNDILNLYARGKQPGEYLFQKDEYGRRQEQVSSTYYRLVAGMFNEGITDRRLRVDFHTLRHTYASWLIMSGKVSLYDLQKLLGHEDIKTTERYAHLSPDTYKRSAAVISDIWAND